MLPPGVVMSVAGKCLIAITGLSFALEALIKGLEVYKAGKAEMAKDDKPEAPAAAPAVEAPKDEIVEKLDKAVVCCFYVPHLAIVYFYIFFRMQYLGLEMPENAQVAMYAGAAGIYLQAIGALVLDKLSDEFAKFVRMLGILVLYSGFGFTLYYAITAQMIESLPVQCALGLITFVCVFQICLVIMQEFSNMSAEDLEKDAQVVVFTQVLTVLSNAVILSILMLYIHFRARMIGLDPATQLPDYGTYGIMMAAGAIGALVVFSLLSKSLETTSAEGEVQSSEFVNFLKMLAILSLYVGFGLCVATCFNMTTPEGVSIKSFWK